MFSKRVTFRARKVVIVTSIGGSPPSHPNRKSGPVSRTYLCEKHDNFPSVVQTRRVVSTESAMKRGRLILLEAAVVAGCCCLLGGIANGQPQEQKQGDYDHNYLDDTTGR